ncbi:hypothetical protein FNF28_00420 [Cafeteria roenbergensis]|uniref:ER membrane protein complex subunit 10 n=1 Tax=Cafeteria roenbergensis TaxID=33653 RepID=A0A5A8E421_CAFRO|nr:hypothetical protein FNF28_00420 [Cafeteria roenbergensis]
MRSIVAAVASLAFAAAVGAGSAAAEPLNMTEFWAGTWAVYSSGAKAGAGFDRVLMNLTAAASDSLFSADTVFEGAMYVAADPESGRMTDDLIKSVQIRLSLAGAASEDEDADADEVSTGAGSLTWLEGQAGGLATEQRFAVQLSADAPGVLIGDGEGAVVTMAKPHFVSIVSGGTRMVLKKQPVAGEKTFFQRYGSMLMIGVIFLLNMGVRAYMNQGGGAWSSKVAKRDAMEEKRGVSDEASAPVGAKGKKKTKAA